MRSLLLIILVGLPASVPGAALAAPASWDFSPLSRGEARGDTPDPELKNVLEAQTGPLWDCLQGALPHTTRGTWFASLTVQSSGTVLDAKLDAYPQQASFRSCGQSILRALKFPPEPGTGVRVVAAVIQADARHLQLPAIWVRRTEARPAEEAGLEYRAAMQVALGRESVALKVCGNPGGAFKAVIGPSGGARDVAAEGEDEASKCLLKILREIPYSSPEDRTVRLRFVLPGTRTEFNPAAAAFSDPVEFQGDDASPAVTAALQPALTAIRSCSRPGEQDTFPVAIAAGVDGSLIEIKVDVPSTMTEQRACVHRAYASLRLPPSPGTIRLVHLVVTVGPAGAHMGRVTTRTLSAEPVPGGGLSKSEIGTVIRAHSYLIRDCRERMNTNHPKASGTVTLAFTVGVSGGVRDVKLIKDAMGEPAMVECMMRAVELFPFPASKDGGTVRVTFPWTFLPTELR